MSGTEPCPEAVFRHGSIYDGAKHRLHPMSIAMPLRLPIGICNVLTFLIFFPLNCLLIWIVYRNKDLKKIWAYKIMAHIAVTDLIILFIVVSTGTLSIMNYSSPNFLAQLCYSLSLSFKVTGTFLSLTLAFNRLFVMLGINFLDKGLVYWAMMGLSWLVGVVLFILILCTLPMTVYIPEMHRFESNYIYQPLYSVWSSTTQIVVFSISGVIYFMIAVKINCQRSAVSKQEFWLSVQAMLPFCWFLITELLMFIKQRVYIDDDVFAITFMFFTRYIPVIHIATYLALNRTLRMEMLSATGLIRCTGRNVNVMTLSSQLYNNQTLRRGGWISRTSNQYP